MQLGSGKPLPGLGMLARPPAHFSLKSGGRQEPTTGQRHCLRRCPRERDGACPVHGAHGWAAGGTGAPRVSGRKAGAGISEHWENTSQSLTADLSGRRRLGFCRFRETRSTGRRVHRPRLGRSANEPRPLLNEKQGKRRRVDPCSRRGTWMPRPRTANYPGAEGNQNKAADQSEPAWRGRLRANQRCQVSVVESKHGPSEASVMWKTASRHGRLAPSAQGRGRGGASLSPRPPGARRAPAPSRGCCDAPRGRFPGDPATERWLLLSCQLAQAGRHRWRRGEGAGNRRWRLQSCNSLCLGKGGRLLGWREWGGLQ